MRDIDFRLGFVNSNDYLYYSEKPEKFCEFFEFREWSRDAEQYVGREDRLGKRIYEYDILKGVTLPVPEKERQYLYFIIHWDKETLSFKLEPINHNTLYSHSKGLEVIGNIHELPNELKDKENEIQSLLK